jgi:hypothetical protein
VLPESRNIFKATLLPHVTSHLNVLPHPGDIHQQVDTRDTPQVNMFKAKKININDGSFTINNNIGGRQGLHFYGQPN